MIEVDHKTVEFGKNLFYFKEGLRIHDVSVLEIPLYQFFLMIEFKGVTESFSVEYHDLNIYFILPFKICKKETKNKKD